MTIAELIESAMNCNVAEIIVRKNGCGWWMQGYRIGKDIEQFPCEYTIEFRESAGHKYPKHIDGRVAKHLTKDEMRDVFYGINLPMKLIKKDVSKLPDNIANLTVCTFQPRHIPSFHREALTHNEFELEINAYPEGWMPEINEEPKATKDFEGQMNLMDFMQEGDNDD